MKMNWCATCGGGRNFGDQLGPILLRHYGIPVEWAKPRAAEIVTVGSILSKVPNGWTGIVLGTGFIRAGISRDMRQARVLAVRGELTRKACRIGSVPLGDLGILVCDLPRDEVLRTGSLTIPHYVDRELTGTASITWPPRELLSAIAAADVVVSSSLHALVAADALGVPHVYRPHPSVHGGRFKFDDYVSAFGETIRPGVERLTPRPAMEARQAELRALVQSLA